MQVTALEHPGQLDPLAAAELRYRLAGRQEYN